MRYWRSLRALAAGALAAAIVAGVVVATIPTSGADTRDESGVTSASAAPEVPAGTAASPIPAAVSAEEVAADPAPAPTVEEPVAVPAPTTAPEAIATPEPLATRAMQCESGTEVAPDGTETSSAVVERVPVHTQLPAGCHWAD